jgi:GTP-binding protein
MNIKSAKFVKSSSKYTECPEDGLPEYAFIGRSNVGKSSLINRLVGIKTLAKTSQTPGKTQLINHFVVNDKWHLVDLPGYGFAKASQTQRTGFGKMIQNYILKRKELTCLFVLIDLRLEPQKIDLSFLQFLGEKEIPFAICFTKADKLSNNQINSNLARYYGTLLETWEELPMNFLTSSEDGRGREDILAYIAEMNAESLNT